MADTNDEALGSEATEEAEEKKKGFPLVPILIALVLIGVVGAGVWFFVLPMLFGPVEAVEDGDQAAEQGATDDSGLYDPAQKLGIIEFENPFTVKLRKNEGTLETETYLLISISLEVATPEIQSKMTGDPIVMARIEDTINTFFAGQIPQNLETPQWTRLKEELKMRINSQFKKEYHVARVNFHDFLMQPGGY